MTEEEEKEEEEMLGYRRQSRAEDRLGPINPIPPPPPAPLIPRGSPSGQFGGQLGEEVGGGAGPPSGQGRGLVGQGGRGGGPVLHAPTSPAPCPPVSDLATVEGAADGGAACQAAPLPRWGSQAVTGGGGGGHPWGTRAVGREVQIRVGHRGRSRPQSC